MILWRSILVGLLVVLGPGLSVLRASERYFGIQVVDESTGRGVPLVELETINHLKFVTDSQGWVAIDEPDLMGQTVYFQVRSHGYEFPKDGFGFHGTALQVEPGGRATLKIRRTQIAERLYRTTGSGVYRDTVLLGGDPPVREPLLQAEVFGCDSVMTAQYQGKIFWFWGDTARPHYPIGGNFHITGATSQLPSAGGLDPELGIDFTYFTGPDGAIRPMAEMPGEGPTWISKLTVLRDDRGQERMYAGFVKIRNHLEAYRWGFVEWNDDSERFELVRSFDTKPAMFVGPQSHPFHRTEGDREYVYFCHPFPLTRVPADPASFLNPEEYEGFTCLKVGTRAEDRQLDRDAEGRLNYAWKINTPPLTHQEQSELIEEGLLKPEERQFILQDATTGRNVQVHGGSVYWNDFRKRWVMIAVEIYGDSSMLGEVWYAEADAPTGPWKYTRKVVTHDKYSFYNPKHHPFFDGQGGRIIYFEGTYTREFSGNPIATPRYDYNQIMYRLELDSPQLNLPVAIYRHIDDQGATSYVTRAPHQEPAFFALERPGPGCVAIVSRGPALQVKKQVDPSEQVAFYALPMDTEAPPATTAALYEFIHQKTGARVYSTRTSGDAPGYLRQPNPICRVWKAM